MTCKTSQIHRKHCWPIFSIDWRPELLIHTMTSIWDARCLHDSNWKRSKVWGGWVLGIVCMEKQGQHKIIPACASSEIALSNLHQVGHAQMLGQICRSLQVWGLCQKLQGYFCVQSLSAILECCRQHRKSELPAALKALHCEFDLNACRWVRAAAGHGSMGLLEWHGNEIEIACFCHVFSAFFWFSFFLWSHLCYEIGPALWWHKFTPISGETTDNQEKWRCPKSLEFVKTLWKKWQSCRHSAWIFICRYRDCHRCWVFFFVFFQEQRMSMSYFLWISLAMLSELAELHPWHSMPS